MSNVLMIAYEFPPTAVGGVFRSAKFARYLPDYGWCPHVLTVSNSVWRRLDDTLLAQLDGVKIRRSPSCESAHVLNALLKLSARFGRLGRWLGGGLAWRIAGLFDLVSIPDRHVLWAVPALIPALNIIRKHNIDVIYSTSWPLSDHLLGLMLHHLTGLPWVADFRDPVSLQGRYPTERRFAGRLWQRLERSICRYAAAIINPASLATGELRRKYSNLPRRKFVTIRNGFDQNDFPKDVPQSEDFLIVHTGTVYLNRQLDGFVQGIRQFLSRRPDAARHTRVRCISASLDRTKGQWPAQDRIEYLPWQPHSVSVRHQMEARLLVLMPYLDRGMTVPAKLYEYMAAGVHILAIGVHCKEIESLLRAYGNATVLRQDSAGEVADALDTLYERWREGELDRVERSPFVDQFRRQRQAAQLADCLRHAVTARQAHTHPAFRQRSAAACV